MNFTEKRVGAASEDYIRKILDEQPDDCEVIPRLGVSPSQVRVILDDLMDYTREQAESKGLHFAIDYPKVDPKLDPETLQVVANIIDKTPRELELYIIETRELMNDIVGVMVEHLTVALEQGWPTGMILMQITSTAKLACMMITQATNEISAAEILGLNPEEAPTESAPTDPEQEETQNLDS